jgi:phage tail sheath protein FI
MVDFLASKITVVEEEPSVRTLPQIPTAIPGFVGLSERGPLDTPTIVTSWDDYRRQFGIVTASAEMPLSVRGCFLNGARQAVIVRVLEGSPVTATVSLNTAASAATAGSVTGSLTAPFDLEPGDTLDVDVDAGGPTTATFNATAASVTGSNTETFVLADGQTLIVAIDGGGNQTITFNTAEFSAIGAALAAEVAAVINAEATGLSAGVSAGAVVITSDSRGTGSSVDIIGGTAAATLGFAVALTSGTGNVVDIDAVTVAEIKTVVEAAVAGLTVNDVSGAVQIVSNTTGASSSINVAASSTADDELGLDNATHSGGSGAADPTLQVDASSEGIWGNGLQAQIEAPTSGTVTGADAEFDLLVIKDGIVVEEWNNVTMLDGEDNYVETVVNDANTGSAYIVVTDLDTTVPAPDDRPAVGTFNLTGGDDGSAVADATFTGGSDPAKGLNTLETAAITLLAIPDQATVGVHSEMITFCEVTRNRRVFAVLDPPAASSIATIRSHKASLTLSEQFSIYWPRVKIPNPSVTVFGRDELITVPPSGYIMGTCARNDAAKLEGPFAQPAGVEDGRLFGVVDIENEDVLRESNRALIFPERINPITFEEGTPGIFIDGARTGQGNSNFPSVGERRGVSFIETTLKQGLSFARHKNNTETLRGTIERTVRAFLLEQTKNGAFASRDPAQAFLLDGDIPGKGINNAVARAQNKVFVRIGLATAKPAEFVVILVSQDTRALQEATTGRTA